MTRKGSTSILGLNAFHGDAAAALVVDGELVCAVEEERLNRVKHCAGFPRLAARWCLEEADIAPEELHHVAVSRNPSANLHRKLLRVARNPSFGFLRSRLDNAARVRDVGGHLAEALGTEELPARVHNVEHHQAHVASAFHVSPFDEAAVLSIDGFGDFTSTMLAHGRGNRAEVLDRVYFPHSLGILYTAITQWLGFPNYGDEGKVMGLAPYGKPRFEQDLSRLVRLTDAGLFELDVNYFRHHREGVDMTWDEQSPTIGTLYSAALEELLGPARVPRSAIETVHEDVAASLQKVFETTYLHVVDGLQRRTGARALCLAGGVALNAVANGLIRQRTAFEDLYIQPAAGDSGTAVGAAFHVWHEELGHERAYVMDHAYTGPCYDDESIAAALSAAGLAARRLEDEELYRETVVHVAEGKVVGWFQGRMEFGPRALGNRSIVADPRRHDMKDVLNARIKQREPFRPFAPSVLADQVGDYYDDDYPSPFMILVYGTLPEQRERVPAVDHVDHTGRVQSVTAETNPRYHRLIAAFAEHTGVPVVLNTSFNENEPIVCTPDEAVACFLKTQMDVLAIGNHLVVRHA